MIQPNIIYSAAILRDAAGGILKDRFSVYRSAPMLWRLVILNPDGSLADISNVTRVNVTITDSINGAPGGREWLDHDYAADSFFTATTLEQWSARLAWQFEIEFTAEDLRIPVTGVSTPYWVRVSIIQNDDEDNPIPVAALLIDLRASGGGLDRDPLAPDGALFYGDHAITWGGYYLTA